MPADRTGGGPGSPGSPGGPAGACPDCGRQVSPSSAKLCPNCGYPLLFESAPATREPPPPEILRKPTADDHDRDFATRVTTIASPPWLAGPTPVRTLGPRCQACHHSNPPRRVRCEICATELWPGSATPPIRSAPTPPPLPPAPPRPRPWGKIAALILTPIIAVTLAYALAYLLR